MSVQPVAHGGMEAKIGAKKMEMKKQRPVVIAVRPVLPPSDMPAPDSMKAVTGERPKREPIEMPSASGVSGEELREGEIYRRRGRLLLSLRNHVFLHLWHRRSGPWSTEYQYNPGCRRRET